MRTLLISEPETLLFSTTGGIRYDDNGLEWVVCENGEGTGTKEIEKIGRDSGLGKEGSIRWWVRKFRLLIWSRGVLSLLGSGVIPCTDP